MLGGLSGTCGGMGVFGMVTAGVGTGAGRLGTAKLQAKLAASNTVEVRARGVEDRIRLTFSRARRLIL